MITKKQAIADTDFGTIFLTTRRTARNITMRVREDGLYITTPPYRSVRSVLDAVAPFRERLLHARRSVAPKPFDFDFRIETECFRLWLEPSAGKNFRVLSDDDGVRIACPEGTDFASSRVQGLLRAAIQRALKKKAEEYLPPLVAHWAECFGLSFRKVSVSKARTRWGSCSAERNISLSYYLMLLPARLMDYVILHELAHTREMNHGPRFWELLDEMTDGKARALRKELRGFRPVF